MLSRREALRKVSSSALTVSLAGCISRPFAKLDDSGMPHVAFNAEVINSFSPSQPGKLRLTFGNETEGTLLFLTQESDGQRGIFTPVRGYHRASSAELLLLQEGASNCRAATGTPSAIPDTPTGKSIGDGCWRPPCEELITYSFNPTWEELHPETPWVAEYVLLDGFNDTCLPAGKYGFKASGRIAKGHLTNDGQFQFDSEKFRIERTLTVTIADDREVSATAGASITATDSFE